MTPWKKRLTPLTQRMAEDMLIRNLRPATIDAYTFHVARFEQFLTDRGKQPAAATPEDIRDFQLHLIQQRKIGYSSFNQAVCGLRFLYRYTIHRPWPVVMIPFGKRAKQLPVVLAREEVEQVLRCISNLKHRTLLLTLYAAGLRLSEGTHLRIRDIDSTRMQLNISLGKGHKQRLVPFSPRLLTTLRQYWAQTRSNNYLFFGKDFETPLTSTSVQKAIKRAARQAGILKNVSPHTLRHSYATAMLESGVDLLTISRLLGHKSFTTTMVYLHVRRTHLGSVPSPIDWLPVRQLPGWFQQQTNTPAENTAPQKTGLPNTH